MIRAIFRDGMIQPLEPLPADWAEGRELQITEVEPSDDPQAIERWCRELSASAASLDDNDEWENLELALAEADRLAKDQMRRAMGLE